jgi:hypothetical protein
MADQEEVVQADWTVREEQEKATEWLNAGKQETMLFA